MTVLILTPLALERAAVLRHLTGVRLEQHGNNLYDVGKFIGQQQEYKIVLRETGPKHAVVSSALEEAVNLFQPGVVLLLGICGGIKDVALGDVVVATRAYNYDAGKITDSGEFVARPDALPFSKELLTAAQRTDRENKWQQRALDGAAHAKVVFGPIASGDKVIASKESELYKRIKQHFSDTTAVEMESHGVAQAAYNHPNVRTLNIRGVSDLIDHKSTTDATGSQEKAADVSAAFAVELLYGLDCSPFMLLNMDPKTIAKEVFNRLFPAGRKEINTNFAVADNSDLRSIWNKVEPFISEEVIILANDPQDADAQADVRNRLRKALEKNEDLQKEITTLLEKAKPEQPSISIENSKNVVAGNTISVGGDFRVGDGDTVSVGKNGSGDAIKGNKTVVNNHYYGPTPSNNQADNKTHNEEITKPTQEFMESLHELVARGRTKEAIPKLWQFTKANKPALHTAALQLSERWKEFEKKSLMGMLSNSEQNVERAQITGNLLGLIEQLKED